MGRFPKIYEMTSAGTFEHIDAFAGLVEEAARDIDVPEDDEVDLMIAVMEAVNNAILHGNHEDPNKQVHLKIELKANTITVCVQDEGDGFVADEVPDPLDPENVLNTSGRGLLMMQAFMDNVEITSSGRGTLIRMTKEFSTKPSV